MLRALLPMALVAATAVQAAEPGDQAWLEARAAVYSQVCMAAAPDFEQFDALAAEAGMEPVDNGWLLQPEAFVSLVPHDGFCSCFMTVGAPDQTAMVIALFSRLMQDWGADFTGEPEGLASVAPFDRNGVEAVSLMEPRDSDGLTWIAARVTVFGACPQTEDGN